MPNIDEILQLPKAEQFAILEAIQANLEDTTDENVELDEDHLEFLRKRIEEIDNGNQKTLTWNEVKQALATKWAIL
jgi:putative addiction module component (TIGR02574 family)